MISLKARQRKKNEYYDVQYATIEEYSNLQNLKTSKLHHILNKDDKKVNRELLNEPHYSARTHPEVRQGAIDAYFEQLAHELKKESD